MKYEIKINQLTGFRDQLEDFLRKDLEFRLKQKILKMCQEWVHEVIQGIIIRKCSDPETGLDSIIVEVPDNINPLGFKSDEIPPREKK